MPESRSSRPSSAATNVAVTTNTDESTRGAGHAEVQGGDAERRKFHGRRWRLRLRARGARSRRSRDHRGAGERSRIHRGGQGRGGGGGGGGGGGQGGHRCARELQGHYARQRRRRQRRRQG